MEGQVKYYLLIAKGIGDSNSPILMLNNKVAHTHLNSNTRQLFETEEGSFIYYKDEEKLHKIDTDKYTHLLLKLQRYEDTNTYSDIAGNRTTRS